MSEYKMPTMDDLKESPRDVILDGVVIGVDIKTWREILSEESLSKFKEENRDQPQVIVTYEVNGFTKDEKISYYEKPTTGSKLGRYMLKYDDAPKVGQKIKVEFDEESRASIVIKKFIKK